MINHNWEIAHSQVRHAEFVAEAERWRLIQRVKAAEVHTPPTSGRYDTAAGRATMGSWLTALTHLPFIQKQERRVMRESQCNLGPTPLVQSDGQTLTGQGQAKVAQRLGLWLLLVSALMLWTLCFGAKPVQAQSGPVCRDEGNLTICGDTFEDFKQDLGIDGYRISGNLTFSTRGGAPVLRVVDASDPNFDGSPEAIAEGRARFEHVAADHLSPYGKKDVVFGDIIFVNDPRQRSGV